MGKNAKPNDMNSYKSRFETMNLGSGSAGTAQTSMEEKAMRAAQSASALGEAMGMGGARVPVVSDPAKTIGNMMDKMVNKTLHKHGEGPEVLPAPPKGDKKGSKDEKK